MWKSAHGYLKEICSGRCTPIVQLQIAILCRLHNSMSSSSTSIGMRYIATIFLGLLESFPKCGDLRVLNVE